MNESIIELTPELESEYRKRIEARNKKLDAQKAPQLKNTVASYLPADFIEFARSRAAELRKANSSKISNSPDDFKTDEHGRLWISTEDLGKKYDREAIERHGNDPLKRFDEWEFPGTPREREFLLQHDFGALIKDSLIALESGSWVYAFGEVGNGKTALAMRAAWELLKSRPSERAKFISMNRYILDQIKRENAEQVAIRRGQEIYEERLNFPKVVILDDFDKLNFKNELNQRVILNLIDQLKNGHQVFVTAQCSLKVLYERYIESWELKPIIDRLRQMCLVLPEFKGKSNRKYRG